MSTDSESSKVEVPPGYIMPILDSVGAILSISICLLVLRVKLFGQQPQKQNPKPNPSAWKPNTQASPVSINARAVDQNESEAETILSLHSTAAISEYPDSDGSQREEPDVSAIDSHV